jgi:hypothetical protein
MNRLREFFTLKKDFSYTILNPLDICIQKIEVRQNGWSRFFNSPTYNISRVDSGQYHIVGNDKNSYLQADLFYQDEHTTVISGWVRPHIFSLVVMIVMLGFWCSIVTLLITMQTHVFYLVSCMVLAFVFVIISTFHLSKSEAEDLRRKLLETISSHEPEKKKKHT